MKKGSSFSGVNLSAGYFERTLWLIKLPVFSFYMANIPGTMQSLQSQSILPQMQFGLTRGHPQSSDPNDE
ncbi:hypothetical protein BRADI_1g74215v3 [Brachypodium distachyon]|uniref:Uncharacterized protein n=1 Tax=Brachypodium distachyon TaxID=15368 RepID=A0A0Q3SEM7_BRADI|nr:hypothetical protein BRADI_1g74215v3 [Brachypodium distachyon]